MTALTSPRMNCALGRTAFSINAGIAAEGVMISRSTTRKPHGAFALVAKRTKCVSTVRSLVSGSSTLSTNAIISSSPINCWWAAISTAS